MGKFLKFFLKTIFILIAVIIVLIVVGAILLVLVVDPNNYKPQLEKLVLEKTGMTLSLPEKISWSFWPVVGLKTTELSLNNASHSAMLALENVDIGLLPGALVTGKLSYVFVKASSLSYGDFLVKNTRFEVNHFQLNQPFSLSFQGQVEKGFALPLSVSLQSEVKIELAEKNNATERGRLNLKNIQAKFNQSTVTGDMTLQSFDRPIIDVHLESASFEVSDFVNIRGAKLTLEGMLMKIHLALDGTSQDKVPDKLPGTLNGSAKIAVKNTVLKGVDVGQALAKIRQMLRGVFGSSTSSLSSLPDLIGMLSKTSLSSTLDSGSSDSWINLKTGGETDLGEFNLEALIEKGVIQNPIFLVTGDRFQIKGAGMIDLNQQSIDYRFAAYGMQNNTPDKYQIPFVIRGPLNDPKMGVDYATLNGQLQQLLQDQAKNALAQKISQSVTNLPGLVRGLLGQ